MLTTFRDMILFGGDDVEVRAETSSRFVLSLSPFTIHSPFFRYLSYRPGLRSTRPPPPPPATVCALSFYLQPYMLPSSILVELRLHTLRTIAS